MMESRSVNLHGRSLFKPHLQARGALQQNVRQLQPEIDVKWKSVGDVRTQRGK